MKNKITVHIVVAKWWMKQNGYEKVVIKVLFNNGDVLYFNDYCIRSYKNAAIEHLSEHLGVEKEQIEILTKTTFNAKNHSVLRDHDF